MPTTIDSDAADDRHSEAVVVTSFSDATWTALECGHPCATEPFDPATLGELPAPARRLLTAALPPGTPLASAVEVGMSGRIKLGIWLPFTAHQVLRAGVGFVWAPVVGRRVVRFVGADSLGPDGARMEFRFHDRISVVDESGPDLARSAAGRLAAETVAWLPQALTPQAGATWRPVDEHRATVSLVGPSGAVDVDVTVDDDGHLTDIDLQRWNNSTTPAAFGPFGGTISSTFTVDDVLLAGRGSVGWERGTPEQHSAVFFEYDVVSARFLP